MSLNLSQPPFDLTDAQRKLVAMAGEATLDTAFDVLGETPNPNAIVALFTMMLASVILSVEDPAEAHARALLQLHACLPLLEVVQ